MRHRLRLNGDVIQHLAEIHLDRGCIVIANRSRAHHLIKFLEFIECELYARH
jgi:hypothetical protein